MKIEDLHALQEDLAKKLEMTNSLLNSKLSSNKKPVRQLEQSSSKKSLHQLDASKKAELIQKAQMEYKTYLSSDEYESSTPMPERRQPPAPASQPRDEILTQKMQMFKEIQSRFTPSNPPTNPL